MNGGMCIFPDWLLPIVGADAAVIVGKVVAFCSDRDSCTISISYLSEVLGKSSDTVIRHIKRLQMLGYIEYQEGRGKGNCGTFKKGANLRTFEWPKRAQICAQKGANLRTINNSKNIVLNSAQARTHVEKSMKEFIDFWNLFAVTKARENERQRCEAKWLYLSEEIRKSVIAELRKGVRRKNNSGRYYTSPYLYLCDYTLPLPVWYNGTPELTAAMREAEANGYKLQAFRLINVRPIVYCKPDDVEQVKRAGGVAI